MDLKTLVICFLSLVLAVNALNIGDQCTVRSSSRSGICRLISDCQSVAAAIRYNFTTPTYCNEDSLTVCCPTIKTKRQSCIVEKNNMPGKCLPLLKCELVKANLRKSNLTDQPTICDKDLQTVCCPSISELKCLEYGKLYTRNLYVNGRVQTIPKCDSYIRASIIGGIDAKEKEFPHMALIGDRSYFCGGSLISDRWVLTAAHCLPVRVVKLGSIRRSDVNKEHLKYRVIQGLKHPEYIKNQVLNDIALLKLDRVVIFNDYIVPMCLPQTPVTASTATATGWGKTETSPSENLMKVELEIFSDFECKKQHSSVDNDMMICAGDRNASKDTCGGDSGGPLQVYRTDMPCMFTSIGITSFGFNTCGTIGVPGAYARTYNYLDWIEETVWPDAV